MKKKTFFKLYSLTQTKRLLVDTLNMRIEEQLAMLLYTPGYNVSSRVIQFNFICCEDTKGISMPTYMS